MRELFDNTTEYNNTKIASDIIENEKYYLEQKEKILDDANFTRDRIIHFNEDLRKRYEDFNYIILTFVIAFSIIFFFILLNNYFPFIPIVPIASIALSIAIIVSFFKYYNISSRWNMDYDVYNYSSPTINKTEGTSTTEETTIHNSNKIVNSVMDSVCIGKDCCSDGTVWDASNNICVPISPIVQSFENMHEDIFNVKYSTYSKYGHFVLTYSW
jgi:hypothetical protein